MRLPISVLCTVSKQRRDFFYGYCLPSVYANGPREVLIDDKPGGAQEKRNRLFRKAKQPYVFFCDDDLVLSSVCLARLLAALKAKEPHAAYAYCHNHAFTMPGVGGYWSGSIFCAQRAWSDEDVLYRSMVHPMSMFRRNVFPGWDESLAHAHMWDVEVALLRAGYRGVLVNESLFLQFYLDDGISNNREIDPMVSIMQVRKKHGL